MTAPAKPRPSTYLAPKGEPRVTGSTPCRYCGFTLGQHIHVDYRPLILGCPDRYNEDRTWKGIL